MKEQGNLFKRITRITSPVTPEIACFYVAIGTLMIEFSLVQVAWSQKWLSFLGGGVFCVLIIVEVIWRLIVPLPPEYKSARRLSLFISSVGLAFHIIPILLTLRLI